MQLIQEELSLHIETSLIKNAALVFRAVNHPLRRQILQILHKNLRLTVTDLYIKLRLEQSVASQHLAILRKAGLVTTERNGKNIFYAVNYQQLDQLHKLAEKIIG